MNDEGSDVSTRDDLDEQLADARELKNAEVFLKRANGEMFALLKNGDVAWAMVMRNERDAGYSTRNPAYSGAPDATIEYRLSNGRREQYPAVWAVPAADALRAAEYFFDQGGRAPFLTWHDDGLDDE